MKKSGLLALGLVLLLSVPMMAEDLQQILDNHFEAIGGLEKIRSIESARIVGKMQIQGMEAPLSVVMKRPGKARIEFSIQGMTGVQATDGSTFWQVMPFLGKTEPEPMSAEEANDLKEQADMDGPLVDWKEKGHTVELVGKEEVEGTPCWKLRLVTAGGDERFYFLDEEHYVLLQMTGKRKIQATEVETVTTFGDYKDVDGILASHVMETSVKGTPFKQVFTFDRFEHNVPVDDAVFAMPVGEVEE
jgi:outer membrane lipoprotein-sorting protein